MMLLATIFFNRDYRTICNYVKFGDCTYGLVVNVKVSTPLSTSLSVVVPDPTVDNTLCDPKNFVLALGVLCDHFSMFVKSLLTQ